MRIPLMLILPVIIIGLLCEIRIFFIAKNRFSPKAVVADIVVAAIQWIMLIAVLSFPKKSVDDSALLTIMWLLFSFATFFLSKLLFVIIDSISCIPRLFRRPRWRAVGAAGMVLSLLLWGGMWWGALINRFNIDVNEVTIESADIPEAFDGLTIVQFSDLHTGTFADDTTFVSRLVERINGLNPDVIVFTGDIVNRKTSEIEPQISPLSRLKAPMGIYSILGNHDYGDYCRWPDNDAKEKNMQRLIAIQKQMGWRLLLDENELLRRGNDSIAIAGVENIGDPPFPTYGSLDKALRNVNKQTYTILLSHNPAHWGNEIRPVSPDSIAVDLTLSGHTHAMQIEILGISPAALRYPLWGGLYGDKTGRRKLYINIGAGTVGMPMRLGATPEITLLTLKRLK